MRHFLILKILLLSVLIFFGAAVSAQTGAKKPYAEVTLKSGEVVRFEYRPFMEENLPLLPEKRPDSPDEVRWIGGRRVIFLEKDTCEKHNIGLENLRVIEVMGMDFNPCSQKKDWLFKVKLLVFDKYVGFFQSGESNLGKALAEHGVKGQLLDQSETVTLQFEDIQTITFFPM